jgi:TonB family protein
MDANKTRKKLRLFIGVSIFLHLLVFGVLYFLPASAPPQAPKAVFVDLNSITPEQLAQMMQKESPKQVVESEPVANAEPPKDAKYLGERSQTVEQETKAKNVDSFRKGGNPSVAGNNGKSLNFKDLAPKAAALRPPTNQELEGYKQERQKYEVAQNQDARMGTQSLDNPGSATNDYLKEVKEGDRTMLSTKEFVYFGYYRRIRERLEVAWNGRLRNTLQSYMGGGGGRQLASNRDYVTGVIVILDRNGTITAVQLMQQSGATDLDKAAVDAFNEAGPFPDPPAGLVDERGEIRIPWNFILQS